MTGIIIDYIVEYQKPAERMGSGVKTIDAVLGCLNRGIAFPV